MKMITKRGIFLWILAVAFLFGLGFMTYSLVENGDTWVMKTYNTHIYKNGDLIGAGTIKSADGAVLAETQDGKRVYAEDPRCARPPCTRWATPRALSPPVFSPCTRPI